MRKCYRITELEQLIDVWEIIKDNARVHAELFDYFTKGVTLYRRNTVVRCFQGRLRQDKCFYITEEGYLLSEDFYKDKREQFTVIFLTERYRL